MSATSTPAIPEPDTDPSAGHVALLRHLDTLQREGRVLELLDLAEPALLEARARRDRSREGDLLVRKGIALDTLSAFDDAAAVLREATAAYEAAGDEVAVARALVSLGVVRSRAGDALAGITYFARGRQVFERAGDTASVLQALNNLALNLKNLDRLDEALATNDEALLLADRLGDDAKRSVVVANRAVLLARLGRDEALAAFEDAEVGCRRQGNPLFLAETLCRHADQLISLGRIEDAAPLLDEAVDVAARMGAREQLQAAHALRSTCFEARGDPASALADLKRAHALAAELADERLRSRLDDRQDRLDRDLALRVSDEARRRHDELRRAHAELQRLHVQLTAQANLLEERSRTDALTGLPNRGHLDEHLRDEVRRAARYRTTLAVAMIDVDRFKQVNDRFTHLLGDEVLRAVGRILRDQVRATDLVARYGGEEFTLVLPETGLAAATAVVAKLAAALATYQWHALHPELEPISVSAGVASSEEGLDLDTLLGVADARLMLAKTQGRARVVAYDGTPAA